MQTAPRTITAILPTGELLSDNAPQIRYAPYCRVSSDSSDQELSFAAQVKYYTELISKMENAELVDVYADEAISGRDTKKREDFNQTAKKAGSTVSLPNRYPVSHETP